MSNDQSPYVSEIDIIAVISDLWSSKWIILAFAASGLLLGGAVAQMMVPKYKVSVPYSFNFHTVATHQKCNKHIKCIRSEEGRSFQRLLGDKWLMSNDGRQLSLKTGAPQNIEVYSAELEAFNKVIATDYAEQAKAELTFVNLDVINHLVESNIVVKNTIHAKRIIHAVNNGKQVISFGTPKIINITPSSFSIVILGLLLGGMVGVAFIFIRDTLRERQIGDHKQVA